MTYYYERHSDDVLRFEQPSIEADDDESALIRLIDMFGNDLWCVYVWPDEEEPPRIVFES